MTSSKVTLPASAPTLSQRDLWKVRQVRLPGLMVHWVMLAAALLLWFAALPLIDLRGMTDLGLITVLPVHYFFALGIVILSCCLMIRNAQAYPRLLLLHSVLLIFILHGTPTLLYGSLRYSWAWKHVGIVDYINRFGVVNPTIAEMNVYHNWPGFFTLSAFLDQASGLANPLGYAQLATLFFNLLALGLLLLIFRSLTTDERLVWLSALFYFLTSWVGQDYYAPQALAFVLHLAVIGINLRWFRDLTPANKDAIRARLRFKWLANLYYWGVRHSRPEGIAGTDVTPARRIGLILMCMIFIIVIVTSHQLTPIMTLLMLAVLVVFRQSNAYYLPVFVIIMTLAWMFFPAEIYAGNVIQSTVKSLSGTAETVQLIDLNAVSPEGQIIAIIGRLQTVAVWGLGALSVLRRLWLGKWDVAPILLAFCPFPILVVNNYGGEMIFRIYMFSLPFMAFLGAGLFLPDANRGRSWFTTMLTTAISVIFAAALLFPYYGKDSQYYFSPEEVAAGQYIVDNAPEGALIIEGTRNYPSRYQNYEYYTYVALSRESNEAQERFLADPVGVMERWMSNREYTASYLIITRSQKVEVSITGPMPLGSLDMIENRLLNSPRFVVVFRNTDAIIFAFADRWTAQVSGQSYPR